MADLRTTVSVRVGGVTWGLTEILRALLREAAALARPRTVWITSASDGRHTPGGAHTTYEAVDIRTRNFPTPGAAEAFAERLRRRLGPDYTVIPHARRRTNPHVHVQVRIGLDIPVPPADAHP